MIHVGKFLDHSGCVLPDIFWKSKQFIKTVHYAPTYLIRYVKLRVTHAPRMPGTFSPPPRVSDPDIHHGTCVTHVAWCMPGSLTSGFLWSRWWGNVPGIPSACATRIFTYLARDPWMCPSGAHLIVTLNIYKDNDYISGIIFFSCIQTRTGVRFPHTNYEIQELNQIVVEGQLFLEWIIIHMVIARWNTTGFVKGNIFLISIETKLHWTYYQPPASSWPGANITKPSAPTILNTA